MHALSLGWSEQEKALQLVLIALGQNGRTQQLDHHHQQCLRYSVFVSLFFYCTPY